MYGWIGGCTTLFGLYARFGVVVLFLGYGGFHHLVNSEAPGNLPGTSSVLQHVQDDLIATHPGIVAQIGALEAEFNKYDVELTDDEIREVLKYTDACTDKNVKDVLSDPDKRREAAWIFYLNEWGREGPAKANRLLVRKRDPVPLKK